MTEIDAAQIALLDLYDAVERMQACAGPDDMMAIARKFVLHRAKQLGVDPAAIDARDDERQSLSMRLAELGRRALVVCAKNLGPEDVRAMVTWSLGIQAVGFIPGLLESLPPDNDTERAKDVLRTVGRQILDLFDRRDEDLFQVKMVALPSSRRRIVEGYLAEARIAALDQDGETARHKYGVARKAVVRFAAVAERNRRFYADTQG